jgi:hypothetical protein
MRANRVLLAGVHHVAVNQRLLGAIRPVVTLLPAGERKSGFTLVVSAIQETTISGMVSSDDGRPIADADVSAAPAEFRGMYMGSAKTDSDGSRPAEGRPHAPDRPVTFN